MKTSLAVLIALCTTVCAFASNPIQIENARQGTDEWKLFQEADGHIEGYGSATSVNRGESIRFYVHTIDPTYTMNIYRMGWYGGAGARKMLGPIVRTGVQQPMPSPDPVTGLIECNWTDPYTLTIPNTADPTDWTSGVYLVKLTANTSKRDKYIIFIVRDDARFSNHNMQICTTTAQAYNAWGGKSLYTFNSDGGVAADKVSFNRPYADGAGTGTFLWRWEYNMVRFLEREGFDVTYSASEDTEARGNLLLNHEDYLSVGHDEYFSRQMRTNVEAARDAGIDIGFFSANSIYWQIRWEPSTIDGAPNRVIVGYKEDAPQKDPVALDSDPSNDNLLTTKFRNTPVSDPEAELIGVQYVDNPVDGDITIDDVTSAPWVFANTGLTTGSVIPGLLGYEVDAIAASSPPSVIRLAHSPFVTTEGNRSGYSDMTVYTAASGATVFATGSIQWAWGVDDWHTSDRPSRENAAAQQITRNVLNNFADANTARDCQFNISPNPLNVPAAAGSSSFTITPTQQCPAWSVTEDADWVAISSSATGSGPGTVTFDYSRNLGPQRTATFMINGQPQMVTQANGCTFTFSPPNDYFLATGGNGSTSMMASSPDCAWTITVDEPWLMVTSALSGVGDATITYTVDPSEAASRDAGIYVNSTRYNVHQSNGCNYQVSPTNVTFPASGGGGSASITVDTTCYWISSTSASWVVLNSGTAGHGNGTTTYTVQPNTTGVARTGNITVAGKTVTITQRANDCTFTVTPSNANFSGSPGSGTVTVSTQGTCSWTPVVETGASFVTLSGSGGTGSGSFGYTIAVNPGTSARVATIRVDDKIVTITQSAAGMGTFGITATGTSATNVNITWSPYSGASSYEVMRSENGSAFTVIGSASSTTFNDTTVTANRELLYRVRAISGQPIAYSSIETASTWLFTDPNLTTSTPIRAVHFTQLRSAIDQLRADAGLAPFAYTSTVTAGSHVQASQITEMRTAVNQARTALGLPTFTFTDPSPTTIKRIHIEELRAAVR
ncbi:MAG TPA: N,N-dimethylformamidase beta subunit family domain-containing protein [Thermoanaerobaculia bacterium]|nr:N,N-dimethylformamidase beta subunit family domain-containing protein [Thermoanaerobaculia bacterium]